MRRCSSVSSTVTEAARFAGSVAIAGLLVACAALACEGTAGRDGGLRIDAATRSFASGDESEPGEPAALPDSWSMVERGRYGEARYRASFHLDRVPAEPWAVYLPRVDTNAVVRINGRPLPARGRMKSPISRMRHYPLLRVLPDGLLRAGENRIEVRLAVEPTSSGSLSRIHLGPATQLGVDRAWREFFQISLVELSALAGLILIVVVEALYGRRGRGRSHRWFQVALGFWVVYASEIWLRDPFFDVRLWEAAANGALYLGVWSIMLGFHRAYGRARPRLEIGVLAAIVAAIVTLEVIPAQAVWPTRAVIGVGLCVLAGYIVAFVLDAPASDEWVLRRQHVVGGLLGLVAGGHDIVSGFVGIPLLGFWLTPYVGSVAIALTLATILVHLFRSMGESRELQRDLEQRVLDREIELEHRYARLGDLDRERVLERERARLTRGLHDGLGAMLVSTLASVESGRPDPRRLADEIRDALDDLRLVMDSLRPERELLDMLARLRSRLAARLERRGVRILWQVQDVPTHRGLASEHALALLRTLQETLAVIDRRDGVSVISVRTGTEARDRVEGVFVEITHDGASGPVPSEPVGPGRRERAFDRILAVAWNPAGTSLRIWLPVDSAPLEAV